MDRWRDSIMSSFNAVVESYSDPENGYSIDASLAGWLCSCVEGRTGSNRTRVESQAHINVWELQVALFPLKSLVSENIGMHAGLMLDSTTAVVSIANIVTNHIAQCLSVAKKPWKLCVDKDIWVNSVYVPRIDIVETDEESRRMNLDESGKITQNCLRVIINPLTARVVGAPQMILQPVFYFFPCSPLPSGTCRTPGLSISWRCLPTSSSVCLVFSPHSLCLAR